MIIIKKRISFAFLAEEYKDAYIILKAIPIGSYRKMRIDIEKADKDQTDELLIKYIEDNFLSGEFPDENGKLQSMSKEDIKQLDGIAIAECFSYISGQKIDPKLSEQ